MTFAPTAMSAAATLPAGWLQRPVAVRALDMAARDSGRMRPASGRDRGSRLQTCRDARKLLSGNQSRNVPGSTAGAATVLNAHRRHAGKQS